MKEECNFKSKIRHPEATGMSTKRLVWRCNRCKIERVGRMGCYYTMSF